MQTHRFTILGAAGKAAHPQCKRIASQHLGGQMKQTAIVWIAVIIVLSAKIEASTLEINTTARDESSGFSNPNAIAQDRDGTTIVVGQVAPASVIGGIPVRATAGDKDSFVARYQPDGIAAWVQVHGGKRSDSARGVAIDDDGGIVVGGRFFGSARFGAGNLISDLDSEGGFLARYDADGSFDWVQEITGAGSEIVSNVAATGDGYVAVGSFTEEVIVSPFYGDLRKTIPDGTQGLFMARFAADGTPLSLSIAASDPGALVYPHPTMIVDNDGEILIAGGIGFRQFGDQVLECPETECRFLGKFTELDDPQWLVGIGGGESPTVGGIAVDSDNRIVVVGPASVYSMRFGSTTNHEIELPATAPSAHRFVAMYSPNGALQWARLDGDTATDQNNWVETRAYDVAIDVHNNILVSGASQKIQDRYYLEVSPHIALYDVGGNFRDQVDYFIGDADFGSRVTTLSCRPGAESCAFAGVKSHSRNNTILFGTVATTHESVPFVSRNTGDVVQHGWHDLTFPTLSDPVLLADIRSFDGRDTAAIRMRPRPDGRVQIRIEEEQSRDLETNHTTEIVSYFAAEAGIIADIDGKLIGVASKTTTSQRSQNQWHTVQLTHALERPVVFAQLSSYRGKDPSHIRIRNVTATSFEYQIEEWDYLDKSHATETISYVAIETGSHQMAQGQNIHVGTVETTHRWSSVTPPDPVTPRDVLLSQSQTINERDPVVTRQRIRASSTLQFRLQEEEAGDRVHAVERVGYMLVQSDRNP